MTVAVLEDIRTLIPPLSTMEYAQLEDSIREHGLLNAVQTGYVNNHGTFVLDGHNRRAICEKLGVECLYTEHPVTFESLEMAKVWTIDHQLGRRNVTNFVRGELVLKKKELVQAEALKRQSTGGTQHMQNSAGAVAGATRDILAKEAGISHNTLDKIEKLTQEADPETLKSLRENKISINKAHNALAPAKQRESTPATKRQGLIAKLQKTVDQFFDVNEAVSDQERKSIEKIIEDLQSVVDADVA
jgi:ParB-like chromosome segregation protein Spo0J